MVMRYYWGLAIGHTYTHNWQEAASTSQRAIKEDNIDPSPDLEELVTSTGYEPEFSLENLEDDLPEDEVEDDDDNPAAIDGDVDPDAYYNMYGSHDWNEFCSLYRQIQHAFSHSMLSDTDQLKDEVEFDRWYSASTLHHGLLDV